MFSDQTYEIVLRRILARVSSAFDKREGSIIFDATAPASFELAILYTALDYILNETFADTATRDHLLRRAAEYGVYPKPAGYAHLLAFIDGVEIAPGTRFSLENDELNYVVLGRLPDRDADGHTAYEVQCETIGEIGNRYFGNLLPADKFISGLTYAALVELLIPGEDEQETESFRQDYFDAFRNKYFGGNRADYVRWVKALQGVGAVKVYPVWNYAMNPVKLIPQFTQQEFEGILPQAPSSMRPWLGYVYECAAKLWLTVGGTVKLVVLGADYKPASPELVDDVQTAIDPERNHGEGLGIAPIGHVVNVFPAIERQITVEFTPVITSGANTVDLSWVHAAAEEKVEEHFLSLAKTWGMSNSDTFATNAITVRWAQIMNALIDIPGLLDVLHLRVTANGQDVASGECGCGCECCDGFSTNNIVLHPDEIPVLLEVIVHDPS